MNAIYELGGAEPASPLPAVSPALLAHNNNNNANGRQRHHARPPRGGGRASLKVCGLMTCLCV